MNHVLSHNSALLGYTSLGTTLANEIKLSMTFFILQVQDRSLELLPCSPVQYHFTMAAPLLPQESRLRHLWIFYTMKCVTWGRVYYPADNTLSWDWVLSAESQAHQHKRCQASGDSEITLLAALYFSSQIPNSYVEWILNMQKIRLLGFLLHGL